MRTIISFLYSNPVVGVVKMFFFSKTLKIQKNVKATGAMSHEYFDKHNRNRL